MGELRRLARRTMVSGLSRLTPLDRAVRTAVLPPTLRRLHDVLSQTALDQRYWMFGGLLLGWAREGAPLAHDAQDVDFFVAAADEHLLKGAAPALERAGFQAQLRYRNNEGRITEYAFVRNGIRFDFFLLFPDQLADHRRFFCYARSNGQLVQLESRIREPPLEPFDFLGRRWLKPRDHDAFLTATYGNWRRPDPGWTSTSDGTIVSTVPWRATDTSWR